MSEDNGVDHQSSHKRSATPSPQPQVSVRYEPTTYAMFQQLKILVLGIASVLDVLLCLLSSILLSLLHICIKSLQESSRAGELRQDLSVKETVVPEAEQFEQPEKHSIEGHEAGEDEAEEYEFDGLVDDGYRTDEQEAGEYVASEQETNEQEADEQEANEQEANEQEANGQEANEQEANEQEADEQEADEQFDEQEVDVQDIDEQKVDEQEAGKYEVGEPVADVQSAGQQSSNEYVPIEAPREVLQLSPSRTTPEGIPEQETEEGHQKPSGQDVWASSPLVLPESNAPTYKALYENEVEINHRVVQEMIILRHKLEDAKLQRIRMSRPAIIDAEGSITKGFEDFSWSSPEMSFINESYEPEMLHGTVLSSPQSIQPWRTRSLDAARTLTNTPSTMDFGDNGDLKANFRQRTHSATDAPEKVGFRSAMFPPCSALSPFSVRTSQSHPAEFQPSSTPFSESPVAYTEQEFEADKSRAARRAYDIVRSEELRREQILKSAGSTPPKRSVDYADRLLEEIVVGRAKLRPRQQDYLC